ncbi:MAG: oligosaccharide flippase family protein [Anaerolineae bacterium]|nr:oligosaccharide flippase family protein [Anaerolineae bacterium]
MIRKRFSTLLAVCVLVCVPLLLFAPVALGSRTLLPVDALFQFEPYRAAADALGVGAPQNGLLADLILENYAWKRLLLQAVDSRQLPLWDPFTFTGHPFLANGQHSALYPLSVVFYILPLWRAFGVFIWLQMGLAGVWAYLFARTLGIRRLGALVTGIAFQLTGFILVSAVHPMIIAGASWLPFVLAMIERVIQQRPALGRQPATLPWALLGAGGLGCQLLVGHAENTLFVALVAAAYATWRLAYVWRAQRRFPARAFTWLVILAVLGVALGAVQFVPLYETALSSFRAEEAAPSLAQVLEWAYPPRRAITFAVPNFFGNPAHHSHFDVFQMRTLPADVNAYGDPIQSHDWGIKNYVEGGAYLGLLPVFLALIAVAYSLVDPERAGRARLAAWLRHPHVPFFTALAVFSLGCIFGTPLYALIYALPFFQQSHSPFRWVFPLALSVATLAGFGIEAVRRSRDQELGIANCESLPPEGNSQLLTPNSQFILRNVLLLDTSFTLTSLLAALAFWGGVLTLAGLVLSRAFFPHIEPLVERAFWGLARAPEAFADHRAFYSYEFKWVGLFGLLLTGTGIVLRVSRCPIYLRRRPVWEFLAVGLLILDLATFGAGFNPAVDPALLDYVPPAAAFLQQDTSLWRYAAFTPPGTTKTMNANVGMFYDLQSVDGYDSTFSSQYVAYMSVIEAQDELQYNRIASFSEWSSLDSPLTDLLNVKYIITEVEIPNPAKYRLVYQDEAVRVYENLAAMPRAFSFPTTATVVAEDPTAALRAYDPHQFVIVEEPGAAHLPSFIVQPAVFTPQGVTAYGINEVTVDATMAGSGWLVLTDAYASGWRAFVRPLGAGESAEQEATIVRAYGNFRAVYLGPGAWTVRFKYSPNSVKVGAFVSFVAGMTVLFLLGLYLWRFFYREEDDASTVKRVAKNSIAPIVLNLFNRAIDFAGAALMARILGPVGNGQLATAINIYLWFDILANFGLDMYLMREVARERSRARQLFFTTTVLRLLLYVAVIPLMAGFLVGWQALGDSLAGETIWAVALFYAGLLPGSVAFSLAALFRGCEKHEIPAAIQTATTIVKVTLWVLILVGGLGVMGVAGASVLTNAITLVILAVLARRMVWGDLPQVERRVAWPAMRPMLAESWPLMASLLLQALFPGVNVLLLQSLQGDTVVGWYDAARKWVDALNIVPQFFTFAVFPVMSRQAAQDRSGLCRSYSLSVKLLTLVALPAVVLVALLATPLVGLLSGREFLPYGADILRLLVWSVLFGWLNSLTNYVLIALDRQRYVLWVSGARVAFTVLANVLFVRNFSTVASAWIMIGGEFLLAVLFYVDLRRHLGPLRWGRVVGRPLLAGLAMAAAAWGVAHVSLPLAVLVAALVYPPALLLLRAVTVEEWEMLAPLVPGRLRGWVGKVVAK